LTVFSSTAPTVAQKHPWAHSGKSRWSMRDDRPFKNPTSFAGANCGGTHERSGFPRRADLPEQVARTLRITVYRYFVIQTR
jgi:hypothetical protein